MHNQADDLTAERAAALLEKCMKMGWAFNGSYTEGQGHYVLAQALKTARQEALRDVQDEIERFIDYSGGCVGTKNNLEVVAVNRFIELTVRPLLDRLAREGVKG